LHIRSHRIRRIRSIKLWQAYTNRDSAQVTILRSTFNLGTTVFNATSHDDDRPDSQFLSWQGQGQYIKRILNGTAQLRLRANVQLASRTLLPLERFSIGGINTVRGYRENTLLRDQAIVASGEFRYRFYQSANAGGFELVPFIDYGYARNRGVSKNAESLLSAGLGLRWSLDNRWFAELHYGYAIEEAGLTDGDDLQDKGIHFQLKANIW
jgi:hemolysin activation/secretion protein